MEMSKEDGKVEVMMWRDGETRLTELGREKKQSEDNAHNGLCGATYSGFIGATPFLNSFLVSLTSPAGLLPSERARFGGRDSKSPLLLASILQRVRPQPLTVIGIGEL
jgi:hypothetical protein